MPEYNEKSAHDQSEWSLTFGEWHKTLRQVYYTRYGGTFSVPNAVLLDLWVDEVTPHLAANKLPKPSVPHLAANKLPKPSVRRKEGVFKYVAYTEVSDAESVGGVLLKHVISPVDITPLFDEPAGTAVRFFSAAQHETIIFNGVDPQFLERVIGIYDTYQEAADTLRGADIWRSTTEALVRSITP